MRRGAVGTALGFVCGLTLAGCATFFPPQTADEFRRAAAGALLPEAGSVEVGRPLPEVAAAFRDRSAQCLNRTATATIKIITNYQEIIQTYVTTYKATVADGPQRVELLVQWRTQGEIRFSPVPADGAYRLIVDAYPLDGARTRLQWYNVTSAHDFLFEAVKGWASGQDMSCPDFATQW